MVEYMYIYNRYLIIDRCTVVYRDEQ